MRDLNPRSSDSKSDALPTELNEHTTITWKNMYLTVKVSSRRNVNIKQENC